MLSTNIKRNLRNATKARRVKEDLSALLTPFTYWTVPTLLGLNGWAGLAAGVGSTWLTGAMFDLPGMTSGGLAVGASHIFHSFFRDEFVGMFGKEPWNFVPSAGVNDRVYGLSEGQSMLPVPDGQGGYQYVSAYEPTDMPQQGVSDHYGAGPDGMADYYVTENGMSDYYVDRSSQLMDDFDEHEELIDALS